MCERERKGERRIEVYTTQGPFNVPFTSFMLAIGILGKGGDRNVGLETGSN